jgi:hypothetical protein
LAPHFLSLARSQWFLQQLFILMMAFSLLAPRFLWMQAPPSFALAALFLPLQVLRLSLA